MTQKTKFAFELLQKELELISSDVQGRIFGGSGGGNGYCFFNALEYLNGAHSYEYYFSAYLEGNGSDGVVYDSNGNLMGVEFSAATAVDFMQTNGIAATQMNPGAGLNSHLSGGGQVLAIMNSGTTGVTHAVVLEVRTATGYMAWDPTSETFYEVFDTEILPGMTFAL